MGRMFTRVLVAANLLTLGVGAVALVYEPWLLFPVLALWLGWLQVGSF